MKNFFIKHHEKLDKTIILFGLLYLIGLGIYEGLGHVGEMFLWSTGGAFGWEMARRYGEWRKDREKFPYQYKCPSPGCHFIYKVSHENGFNAVVRDHISGHNEKAVWGENS